MKGETMEMSEWKKEQLLKLWDVDRAIRSEQEAKKEAMKEFSENIKGLEATRDRILDKLAGGAEQLNFDDEPTDPDGKVLATIEPGHRIELDPDNPVNDEEPPEAAEDPDDPGPEAPEPGTYLGEDDDIDPDDPAQFFSE